MRGGRSDEPDASCGGDTTMICSIRKTEHPRMDVSVRSSINAVSERMSRVGIALSYTAARERTLRRLQLGSRHRLSSMGP